MFEAPRDLEAKIYSFSRILKTCDLTTLKKLGQLKTTRIKTITITRAPLFFARPRDSTLCVNGRANATNINVVGNASKKSQMRPMKVSYAPPMSPAEIPKNKPTATKVILVIIAIEKEIREPYVSSPKRSRPTCGSTPNGWCQLTPPQAPFGSPSGPIVVG